MQIKEPYLIVFQYRMRKTIQVGSSATTGQNIENRQTPVNKSIVINTQAQFRNKLK